MRWRTVNYIFVAYLATTIATDTDQSNERPKRDLQFWKEILAAKLGLIPPKPAIKVQNIKIVPMPPYEQVIVRDAPKFVVESPVRERLVPMDPTVAVLQSYLGTRTPDETILALQGVKNLLGSGVLRAREEFVELAPQRESVFVIPPLLQQRIYSEPRPIFPIVQKTMVPMPAPMIQPVYQQFPVLPPPPRIVSPKVVLPEIRPLPPAMVPLPFPPVLAVPGVPANYSYKQMNTNVSVPPLVFGNPGVVVAETARPLPPPPSYIVDRFQKIVYGLPLGVARLPAPPLPLPPLAPLPPPPVLRPAVARWPSVIDVAVPPRFVVEPGYSAITGPSDVKVTVKHNGQRWPDSSKIKIPNPVIIGIPSEPLTIPPPPEIFSRNKDRDISTGKPDKETAVNFEHISKLPPPPPHVVERLGDVVGRTPNGRRGYSMHIANGAGSIESHDGGKIFYSRLEPASPDESVFPDPLSSQITEVPRKPSNVIFLVNDKENGVNGDELGGSNYATEDNDNPISDIQPVKKYPKLPMPIAGENEKSPVPTVISIETPLKPTFDVQISDNPKSGSSGFSYTQVNHDGSMNKVTGDGKWTGPEMVAEPFRPTSPAVSVDVKPLPAAGFSYTQVNHDGSMNKVTGDGKWTGPEMVAELYRPTSPAVSVDVKPLPAAGFSYTQVNHDSSVNKVTGNSEWTGPDIGAKPYRPTSPAVSVDVKPLPVIPAEVKVENQPILETTKVRGPVRATQTVKIPVWPNIILKPVPHPVPPPSLPAPAAALKDCEKTPTGFSYTHLDGGKITTIRGNGQRPVLIEKIERLPGVVRPAAIVEVVKPFVPPPPPSFKPRPASSPPVFVPPPPPSPPVFVPPPPPSPPVLVKVPEKKPAGTVMFAEPVVSNYVYKQISHSNPRPFTIVPVGDLPFAEVPKGDVTVKVNKHEHVRPDGTRYPCTEVHMVPPPANVLPASVVPAVPASPLPPPGIARVPSSFVYVPPVGADAPRPDSTVQVKTRASKIYSKAASATERTTTESATDSTEHLSLDLNPIVVAPEDSNFSYTQTHSDGSSINVHDNKDKTVSVNVTESRDKLRGDIPDALA